VLTFTEGGKPENPEKNPRDMKYPSRGLNPRPTGTTAVRGERITATPPMPPILAVKRSQNFEIQKFITSVFDIKPIFLKLWIFTNVYTVVPVIVLVFDFDKFPGGLGVLHGHLTIKCAHPYPVHYANTKVEHDIHDKY
jgi:hypothetical protein